MNTCLESALLAHSNGISVLPPRQDGTKAPDAHSWSRHQRERSDEQEIRRWYSNGRTGVGWVTGLVSGGLEVMDFDDRSVWAEYQRLCADAGLSQLLDRVAGGYLEHSPNGAHLAYRCNQIDGNTKLAKDASKSLIETRGEGGFIIVAPSYGSVNLKGPYELQRGSVASIQTITPDERKALHDLARIFDADPRPVDEWRPRGRQVGSRPGDDYNVKATWEEILKPHGWVRVGGRLGASNWRRPGKKIGFSATTNYKGSGLLYVFSTSTEFEANRGYSKFSAYTILEHGGDFSAAASALSLLGYGVEEPFVDDVDISGILLQGRAVASDTAIPTDINSLLKVPGLVGELAEWIDETSIQRQPILSVAASIAAVGTILGRKVKSPTNLRTNLYVLGVAESCSGKERARQAIKTLFAEINADRMIGGGFASSSGADDAVIMSPSCLFLIDEVGHLLGSVNDDKAPPHIKDLVPTLLSLYSESESSHTKKAFARSRDRKDHEVVHQPCLSIYGCTTPQKFERVITKSNLSDGLLGRLLVFESDDADPEISLAEKDSRVPPKIVDEFALWLKRPVAPGDLGTSEVVIPEPVKVPTTTAADSVFDDLAQAMRRRKRQVREAGDDQGPWGRVISTAIKLALIRACGINHDNPEISESDAEWGAQMAWACVERTVARVSGGASENKTEDNFKRTLELIRKSGRIFHRDLVFRTRWMSSRERLDVLAALIQAECMSVSPIGKTKVYEFKNRQL